MSANNNNLYDPYVQRGGAQATAGRDDRTQGLQDVSDGRMLVVER